MKSQGMMVTLHEGDVGLTVHVEELNRNWVKV